ncbi:hypothetical protein JOF29_000320 [Kribbella aluminosa]|uniref:DUF998 domain-containing protein n=1 Tax=Kribbella aluminosa TaxID=416017 RepID=A0ABS4UC73_9ACTN|nr:DUF998 domain-containing protein [Kribbella aluminosa]MBP2349237.1 hypothetical protein [Kribbella aluminosa]
MVDVPYRLLRTVMFAAAVLYCSLLLEAAAGFPLDVHHSFLSELGALDQSTSHVARAMDLTTGVLLLVGVLLARSAARGRRELTGLLVSTAAFALGTLFDALSPMDCAPSASEVCGATEADGQTGVGLVLHEVTSTIAGLGSIAMGVYAVLALRKAGWGGARARAVAVLAAGVAVTQAWLGLQTGSDVLTGDDLDAPGILQRVSVLLVCLMLGSLLPALRQAYLDEHDVDRGARLGRSPGGVRAGSRAAAR